MKKGGGGGDRWTGKGGGMGVAMTTNGISPTSPSGAPNNIFRLKVTAALSSRVFAPVRYVADFRMLFLCRKIKISEIILEPLK